MSQKDLTTLTREELLRRLEAVREYCEMHKAHMETCGLNRVASYPLDTVTRILELTEGGHDA